MTRAVAPGTPLAGGSPAMLIDQVTNAGATPALEMVIRFAGARQREIAHNVANLTTPGFRPVASSVGGFQDMLREAIHARRAGTGGMHGELGWRPRQGFRRGADGGLEFEPRAGNDGILFQDQAQRDLERQMQALAENAGAFRMATDLLRQQVGMMRGAMAERVV